MALGNAARSEDEHSTGANALSVAHLTAREMQVLRLMAEGKSNKEIAWQLRISTHTAKAHVGSIMQKLGASSRTEAAVIFLRSGTTQQPSDN